MNVISTFNLSTSFANLNVLNISGLPSIAFSVIVGIEIFSNKAEQTSPKGEALLINYFGTYWEHKEHEMRRDMNTLCDNERSSG